MDFFIKKVKDHTCEGMPKDWNLWFVDGRLWRDKIGRHNNHGSTPFIRLKCSYSLDCDALVLVRAIDFEDYIAEKLNDL